MLNLFADLIVWGGGGPVGMLVQLLILLALVAIAYIFITQVLKWTIPPWLVQIGWIVLGLIVVIWAIRLVMSL